MKKLVINAVAIAAIGSFLYGGSTKLPVPTKPIPIPTPQKAEADLEIPLGLYLGGGLTYAKTECKCNTIQTTSGLINGNVEGSTYGINLKGGYDFNQFVGIEAKYLHTPWGDDGKALKHYGLYLKPNYTIDENFDIYALLGYGKTECEYNNMSKKGFAWGLGSEYTLNKKRGKNRGLGVYVEYLKPLKKSTPDDIDTNVANIGVAYHY